MLSPIDFTNCVNNFKSNLRFAEISGLSQMLIIFSAFSAALAVGISLHPIWALSPTTESEVVGWVTVHHYSKPTDILNYFLALTGIPFLIIFYLALCSRIANYISKKTSQPKTRVIEDCALASLPFNLMWAALAQGELSSIYLTVLPGILSAISFSLVYFFNKKSKLRNTPAVLDEVQITAPINTETCKKASRFNLLLKYALVPTFLYLTLLPHSIDGLIDFYHEGELLGPINQLQFGGKPYLNIYVQHGLLTNIAFPKFATLLFGDTLEAVRHFQNLLQPLPYVALYLLALATFSGNIVAALLVVFLSSGAQYWISIRKLFAILALYSVMRWIDLYFANNRELLNFDRYRHPLFDRKLLLAGAFSALAFWQSVEIGIYVFCAITLFLIMFGFLSAADTYTHKVIPLFSYLIGSATVLIAGSFYLIGNSAFPMFLSNLKDQLLIQSNVWGLPYFPLPKALAPLAAGQYRTFILSEGLRWYLPPLIFLLSEVYLLYRFLSGSLLWNKTISRFSLLLLASVIFYYTALGRSDVGHLVDGQSFLWLLILFPAIAVINRSIKAILKKSLSIRLRLMFAGKIGVALFATIALTIYVQKIHFPLTPWKTRLSRVLENPFSTSIAIESFAKSGRVQIPATQEHTIRKVVSYIQNNTSKNEPIYDFSNNGAYYFFANRPSATRFQQTIYASHPRSQLEVVAALQTQQVKLVIYNSNSALDAIDGISNEMRLAQVARYINKHYRLAENIDGTLIYLQKD